MLEVRTVVLGEAVGRCRTPDMTVVHAVELGGGLVEMRRERLLELGPKEADDSLPQQSVGSDGVEAVEGLAQPGVMEPGGLRAFL